MFSFHLNSPSNHFYRGARLDQRGHKAHPDPQGQRERRLQYRNSWRNFWTSLKVCWIGICFVFNGGSHINCDWRICHGPMYKYITNRQFQIKILLYFSSILPRVFFSSSEQKYQEITPISYDIFFLPVYSLFSHTLNKWYVSLSTSKTFCWRKHQRL